MAKKQLLPIVIISMTSPVEDSRANRGVTQSIKGKKVIIETLKDVENWTDDDIFHGEDGRYYSIDDLVGKKVTIGKETFYVPMEDGSKSLEELRSELPVKDSNPFNLSAAGLRKQKKELKRIKKFGYGV